MTEIEKAEAAIESLDDKRQHLNQRAVVLAEGRNWIAFAAAKCGFARLD